MSKNNEEIKEGYIRVTELLSPWKDLSMIPPQLLEEKAQIGTNVHEAIATHSLGIPTKDLTERENKYFSSYHKWNEKEKPEFFLREERFYDEELMLTGQIDAIVQFPEENVPTIVDFKCTASASKKHWSIQLGWYYLLARKNGIPVQRKAFCVQLNDKDKEPKIFTCLIENALLDICKALYQSYIFFNDNPIKNSAAKEKVCD